MQHVLIISYFYPPCTLTASARPSSWAAYLHEFGYYPTIVTRSWDTPIASMSDMSRSSGTDIRIEQTPQARIVYAPYRASLKDRLYARHGDQRYRLLRRALSFAELVLQHFTLRAFPFDDMYHAAVAEIERNREIKKVVISANPFISFYFGYLLKQRFPDLQWVADYRDDWTTTELVTSRSTLQRFLHSLDMRSERKWVGSAAAITSVSPYYVQKISAFTGRPGHVLLNGYSEADAAHVAPTQSPSEFVITYNGTLYESQAIEVFLEGYKKVADAYKSKLNFKLYFPGLAFDPSQRDKVLRHMVGYEHLLHITDRIPRAQVFDMQNASHAFLMVAHQGLKGIPSSKLYEYLNFKKPIILCPDDEDIIHETLADTGLGVVCRDSADVTNKLTRMAEDILNFGAIKLNYDAKNIEKYSRKSQVKVLADILHSI